MNTPANNSLKTATLIRVNNPFDVSDQTQELLHLSEGVKLGSLITLEPEYAISINGELLENGWDQHAVFEGDYVVLCPVPAGGGGAKNILRIVALIAVAIAAPWAAGGMLGALGIAAEGAALYGTIAAVTVAGSMIVNSLIPIEQSIPQSRTLEDTSPSYGIDGPKNTEAEGIPVPVIYGTYRVGGNLVNIYTENLTSDDTQDLYMLFALSEGEISAVDAGSIELNDQPIANFNDFKIESRMGTADQDVIPWFEDSTVPYPVGVTLSETWHTYTTQGVVEKLRVDIVTPQGFREINDSGESLPITRHVEIEYRPAGTTDAWQTAEAGDRTQTGSIDMAFIGEGADKETYFVDDDLYDLPPQYYVSGTRVYRDYSYSAPTQNTGVINGSFPKFTSDTDETDNTYEDYHGGATNYGGSLKTGLEIVGYVQSVPYLSHETKIHGKKTSPYRKSFSWPVPSGEYEVRVRRTTPESEDGQIIDKIQWSDLNEITLSDVRYKHTALLGVQIRLTDQLNTRPKITVEVSGKKVRTPLDWYQVGNTLVERYSSNPAWIALDMLTNQRYGAGYGDHRIDFHAWMRWAAYCDQLGLEFNGIFDVNASFWDQLSHVLRCGRAKIVPQGIKYSVAVERADFPAMMFNVSNMKKSTLTINWLSMSERANEIEATYYDKENGYKASALKVVSPTLQQGVTPRVVSLNLIGVTNAEQARREAQLLLNMNRFIQQTISFEAPVEALACRVGSMVLVQHDIPQWGFGGRTDAGSTTTTIKLDRMVEMEAGKNYTLLLNYDNLLVSSGLLDEKINSRNFLIDTDYIREGVHSLFVNGNEYSVAAMSSAGDGVRKILTLEENCPALEGEAYELYRLDALEERNVTTVVGESDEIQLTAPMPQAPGRYVKWLFGVLEGSQKQFRVISIEGEGVDTRTLTCVEYYGEIYNTDDAIAEPPNYSALPVGEQVTGLTATQIRKNIGVLSQPVVRLEWIKTQSYTGADVLMKRGVGNWQLIGQVRSEETSFEFEDVILGEELSFMVLAINAGGRASKAEAPVVTITVSAADFTLDPPTSIIAYYVGDAIRLDYENPDAANYLETEVFHATVNDVLQTTKIFRSSAESFTHASPAAGDNFYWLRSVNTNKMPGPYSNAVAPGLVTALANLRLKSAFVGDAAHIIWDSIPTAAAYQVEVRTKSTLRRSERVTTNEYRYGIEDALEDGDVDRDIEFTVWAIGVDDKAGASMVLAVTNPPPALPTDLSVVPGFNQTLIKFTPPTDPDYVDTLIWVDTVTGFTPNDTNRVAAIKGGPITIGDMEGNTSYYIRLTSRDSWGEGLISSEFNATTLDDDFGALSPWAYVEDADRQFIDENLHNDAIASEKIVSLTASRITTGTLAATEKISVEGQLESVVGTMVATVGPKSVAGKVALISVMNSSTPIFTVNEDGSATFTGTVSITGGAGYASLTDKPTSLSAINSGEGSKLGGIQSGADVTGNNTSANTNNVGIYSANYVQGASYRAANGLTSNGDVARIIRGSQMPATNPSTDGLYMNQNYMGFYKGGSGWQTWIHSSGSFHFGGDNDNYLEWNGSTLTLKLDQIGSGASSGDGSIAFGIDAVGSGYRSVAIGVDSYAAYNYSASVGYNATGLGLYSVTLGAYTAAAASATALGYLANASGSSSVALGRGSSASGTNAVAIGANASASANRITLGASGHTVYIPGTLLGGEHNTNAVGSWALLRNNSGPWTGLGGTLPGSQLGFAHTGGWDAGVGTPAGTWRCHGVCPAGTIALFQRII